MPHVIVKLWPGKSEQQKTHLAETIATDVMSILHYGEESVSVAIEEVRSQDWAQAAYKPHIQQKWDKLYKKPGYTLRKPRTEKWKGIRYALSRSLWYTRSPY